MDPIGRPNERLKTDNRLPDAVLTREPVLLNMSSSTDKEKEGLSARVGWHKSYPFDPPQAARLLGSAGISPSARPVPSYSSSP